MKTYPYENAPSKEVGIALWFLERNEWCWRKISEFGYLQRSKLAAKTVALIAHDRVLTGELVSRGLPVGFSSEGVIIRSSSVFKFCGSLSSSAGNGSSGAHWVGAGGFDEQPLSASSNSTLKLRRFILFTRFVIQIFSPNALRLGAGLDQVLVHGVDVY